jgi:hypothetical protein
MARDQHQLVPIGAERVAKLLEQRVTLLMIGRPLSRMKGPTGGSDNLLHISRRCICRMANNLSGPGAHIVKCLATRGGSDLAVDVPLSVRKDSH